METANFLNHHPFSRSLPRSRSQDGDEEDDDDDGDIDEDDGDDEEDDDSEGIDDGVWLKLAMIIIMLKSQANGCYDDKNDVDTGSVLMTLIMMIMFLAVQDSSISDIVTH